MTMAKVKVAAVILIAASAGAGAVVLSQVTPGAAPAANGQVPAVAPPAVRMAPALALSKDDIVAGLRQRETSIADITYRVSTKQFLRGNDQPVDETVVSWMSKGDMFKYELPERSPAERPGTQLSRMMETSLGAWAARTSEVSAGAR
jgi:hypothetical protein